MSASYRDCTLAGQQVVLFWNSRLEFNGVRIELPSGQNLLKVRIAPDGSKFAGIGHEPPVRDRVLEWINGAWDDSRGPGSSVIYDHTGFLHVAQGSPGFRYVDPAGRIWNTDETNRDLVKRIWDFTDLGGGLLIGQGGDGPHGPDPVIAWLNGVRYLLQLGQCKFINAYRENDQIAFAYVQERPDGPEVNPRWLTLDDIRNSPTINDAAPPVTVAPLPDPLWIAPIWSHGKYGDTPDHAGNTIWTTDPSRYAPLGLPMISTVPGAHDLVIAYWVDGGDPDVLGSKVRTALGWPQTPVIAYLDQDGWPTARPGWVTDRVWPGVQLYPNPGEGVAAFEARGHGVLQRVASYGQRLALVPAFYTRNGAATVDEILAAMPLYDRWLREFACAAFLPFADRRPTGMLQHPEFRAWAHAFNRATGRPRREHYWTPDSAPAVCPCCGRPR